MFRKTIYFVIYNDFAFVTKKYENNLNLIENFISHISSKIIINNIHSLKNVELVDSISNKNYKDFNDEVKNLRIFHFETS